MLMVKKMKLDFSISVLTGSAAGVQCPLLTI